MMQSTLIELMKRPRLEEISHKSVVYSNGKIAAWNNNSFDGNLDLNLAAEDDSFEHQPSSLEEDSS